VWGVGAAVWGQRWHLVLRHQADAAAAALEPLAARPFLPARALPTVTTPSLRPLRSLLAHPTSIPTRISTPILPPRARLARLINARMRRRLHHHLFLDLATHSVLAPRRSRRAAGPRPRHARLTLLIRPRPRPRPGLAAGKRCGANAQGPVERIVGYRAAQPLHVSGLGFRVQGCGVGERIVGHRAARSWPSSCTSCLDTYTLLIGIHVP
jgi:hypothetical protein